MPIQVETRDCAALTDADLDEMASMGGAFDIGVLSKAKEDWVLARRPARGASSTASRSPRWSASAARRACCSG